MNAVLKIALTQLKQFYCNPIAWLMFVVFTTQASLDYLYALSIFSDYQTSSYTAKIFTARGGLFDGLPDNLLLYVPLLTMGLIAREAQSGSIKLLQSAPLSVWQWVLGKHLAVMLYFLLPVAFLLGLIAMTATFLPNIQLGLLLTAILGVYMLIGVYSAIGIFISSIAPNQVVAAVVTIVLVGVLSLIGTLGQRVPVVNEIAYWFSVSDRISLVLNGVLVSKDIIYFLSVMTLFIGLTCIRLNAGRRSGGFASQYFRMAGLIMATIVVGIVSSQPRFLTHYDATYTKNMSLSNGARSALEKIEGPWEVTAFVNALDPDARRFLPRFRNVLERHLFEQYLLENPDGKFNYVWYYGPADNPQLYANNPGRTNRELAERFAYRNRLDFDQFIDVNDLGEIIDFDVEGFSNIFQVQYGEKTELIRTFDDSNHLPSELHIGTAFKRLTFGHPSIAYVVGQGERRVFERGGENHRRRVGQRSRRGTPINVGFDVEEIGLDKPVPEHIDILVLAAPTKRYSATAQANLISYIKRGGNGIVYAEPHTGEIVNPLLAYFGVELVDGNVVQPGGFFPRDIVFAQISLRAKSLGLVKSHGLSDDADPMGLVGAGALRAGTANGFNIAPAMEFKSPNARLENGSTSSLSNLAPAFALRRIQNGKPQKWLVIADADFQSSAVDDSKELEKLDTSILFYNQSMWSWLNELGYPIDTGRRPALDSVLNIERFQVGYLRILLCGVFPASVLLLTAAFLISRRRA